MLINQFINIYKGLVGGMNEFISGFNFTMESISIMITIT